MQTDSEQADDEATTVDSCTTITEPGVYELGPNLTNQTESDDADGTACIVVQADDVVVEGNGAAIDGSDANGDVGVAVRPSNDSDVLRNATVRNVEASNWTTGVLVENATKSAVENVESSGNSEAGVEVRNLTYSAVTDVRATDNGDYGLVVNESSGTKLTNVSATNHSVAGVAAVDSSKNLITDVEVNATGDGASSQTGGLLFDNASNNVVKDASVSETQNWAHYSTNGSADNLVARLSDEGQTVSFVGTDVAVRYDDGSLVVNETTEDGSILVLSR
jgi:hypothetical protein